MTERTPFELWLESELAKGPHPKLPPELRESEFVACKESLLADPWHAKRLAEAGDAYVYAIIDSHPAARYRQTQPGDPPVRRIMPTKGYFSAVALGLTDIGLYIVTLNNEYLISVNANDPRIAEKCIRVSREHCKFGKAKSLARRRIGYQKVFGVENVNFRAIAHTTDVDVAERVVLEALGAWRMRGRTGRKNEWLAGIGGAEVERIALEALAAAGIGFVKSPTHQYRTP